MNEFLQSLLWLSVASFICVFGIGCFAFRKDLIAAWKEWRKA